MFGLESKSDEFGLAGDGMAAPRRLPVALLVALLLAAAGFSAGCRRPAPPDDGELHLAQEPAELSTGAGPGRTEVVFRWSFEDPEDLEGWTTAYAEEFSRAAEGGLRIVSDGRRVSLWRPLEIDAREVDAIEVDVAGFDRRQMWVFWAPPGEAFGPQRGISLDGRTRGKGAALATYTFDLGSHPEWRGAIARLRLDPGAFEDRAVRLKEVRGIKVLPGPAAHPGSRQP